MLGHFESSLRGRTSWSGVGEDPLQKKTLHKTCIGHAHGHGVRKEKSVKGRRLSAVQSLKNPAPRKIKTKFFYLYQFPQITFSRELLFSPNLLI
jgi:hypothetical protein